MLRMGDAVNPANLPAGLDAYAGYDDGQWPDFPVISAQHPNVPVLDITVVAINKGTCLDIENGDATIDQAPDWYKKRVAAGVNRPAFYTSESNLLALVTALSNAGVSRYAYRVWSAHYGVGKHICGPTTCGSSVAADGTQWIDHGGWDESLLNTSFFSGSPAPNPTPSPGGDVQLPTIRQGNNGYWTKSVQALCKDKMSQNVVVDGNFGPATTQAVKNVQTFFKTNVDGVVGPETWAILLGM